MSKQKPLRWLNPRSDGKHTRDNRQATDPTPVASSNRVLRHPLPEPGAPLMAWGMDTGHVNDQGLTAGARTPAVAGLRRRAVRRAATAARDAEDLVGLLAALGLNPKEGT